MSRTDKDMPAWVRAEWYEPYHRCGWIRRSKFRYTDRKTDWGFTYTDFEVVGFRWVYLGDCDLPAEPEVVNPSKFRRRRSLSGGNGPRCYWDFEWPRDYNYMSRGTRKKSRRHTEFHGPQRTAERVAARAVIAGDWEAEFPDGRERSSVLWDLW